MNVQEDVTFKPKEIPESIWESLSTRKMFFGHMSVGFNILNGIEEIIKISSKARLRIVESTDPVELKSGTLLHSKVGKNTDPLSKIVDFERAIENGLGKELDVAFLKFCYVDIVANTDVDKVFAAYRSMVERIKNKYPSVSLVHFTPPLTIIQTGPKAWIKDIIGKPLGGMQDNIKRSQYAKLLKNEYGEQNAVFDLAEIESTNLNYKKETFTWKDKQYPYLLSHYTDDWGHLNQVGQKWVAEKLIVFLGDSRSKQGQ